MAVTLEDLERRGKRLVELCETGDMDPDNISLFIQDVLATMDVLQRQLAKAQAVRDDLRHVLTERDKTITVLKERFKNLAGELAREVLLRPEEPHATR